MKNNKKNETSKIILKLILMITLIMILSVGVVFGRYLYKSGGSVSGAVINILKDTVGEQKPVFILLMGVSQDIGVDLTDTIMLLGFNPVSEKGMIISIPRDTFIGTNKKRANSYDKINALYQKSPEKTVEAVENITGINIDYYVIVNTKALVKIVDAIGGVEFDVPINMNYDDSSQKLHIHLKSGKQILNGKQSEQLLRFRHNNNGTTYSQEYGDNDEGRMRTQRAFIKEAAKQVISWNNVSKIEEIVKSLFENVETNMPLSKIIGYIPYAVEVDVENIAMEQIEGTTKKINELWFFEIDKINNEKKINELIDLLELKVEDLKKIKRSPSVN